MVKRAVTIVEIDIDFCQNVYGTAPCTAALGLTGDRKCFQSAKTCQDRNNFNPSPKTIRFCAPFDPFNQGAIPNVTSVSVTPQIVKPGESIGERSSVSVTFTDHPHNDVGYDNYLSERDYRAFGQGTYWAKFKARHPYIKGRALRLITGFEGDALEDMDTRHYFIESCTLQNGAATIVAKDVLKLTNGDRALAPRISKGQLLDTIDSDDTTLVLTPPGIGNLEYPASGSAGLGGNEYVTFTRVGDNVTLTARGLRGTEQRQHEAGEVFQLALVYDGETAAFILNDLLTNYTETPSGYIDLTEWEAETESEIGRLYSAEIAVPTPVDKLVNEVIEQVGLVMWTDEREQAIRLRSLRPIALDAQLWNSDRTEASSFKTKEQPERRYSQVWTWFARYNPCEKDDKETNFRSSAAVVDLIAEDDHGGPAIKKIFSRWIPLGNRPAALDVGSALLARFRDPPRRFTFSVRRDCDITPTLGSGYRIEHPTLVDDTGAPSSVPVHLVSVEPHDDVFEITAEEFIFSPTDDDGSGGGVRYIILDVDTLNVNLRDIYDSFYTAPVSGATVVKVVVEPNVVIGSADTSLPAMDVGDWPDDIEIEIYVQPGAWIIGCGGRGADGGHMGTWNAQSGNPGSAGGPSVYSRYPFQLYNAGVVAGGGGGGGGGGGVYAVNFRAQSGASGSGGGGGAGLGNAGQAGSLERPDWHKFGIDGANGGQYVAGQGGAQVVHPLGALNFGNGPGGNGGEPGLAGSSGGVGFKPNSAGQLGSGGSGGQPGAAIDGVSYVTYIDSEGNPPGVAGDIRGPMIN